VGVSCLGASVGSGSFVNLGERGERERAVADYVLLTTGEGKMPEGDEAMTAFMDAWGAWVGELGAALKDGGNPFAASTAIDPSGAVTGSSTVDASGYVIITANSMEDAVEMAKGCPALVTGNTVNVFETASMGPS
jgi:hypothetical protein